MKVKTGEHWQNGSLQTKLDPVGWVVPDRTLLKQDGEWGIIDGIEIVKMTDIGELLSNVSNWTYHSTRGWYRNVRTTETNVWLPTKFSTDYLARIRRVSATFTGYYDNPEGSLGTSMIAIRLSDGTVAKLGTRDSWTNGTLGQRVFKGERFDDPDQVTQNVISKRFTYVVPEGLTVVGLALDSMGRVSEGGGTLYPYSLRGMRDFEFTLQH